VLPRPIKVGQMYDFSLHVTLLFQDVELMRRGTNNRVMAGVRVL